ncbi:MAG: RdgB/HAM1 family non-canonical purine NTP pyrophosphatase [Microlunatus sp.]|nr:RdgB/HAM1 family non-canonical purine NTP pyrophosphatase [Microlunatus sp.]MDN5771300.1 RdgB/HAM1 family non-canonical purine NTP pyrophosphatase [Microlunatus sp.]MDN5804955.1 RdgB/HAM1 family non-canonical purine NTP pyrophosphatase [Microlunatus sp.]
MTQTQMVLATHNAKKLSELRRLVDLAGLGVVVLGLADLPCYPEPAETATTFEANALIKARAAVEATGMIALADDSGLAVDRLNGMPGVRSARWAGPGASDADNNDLLLRQLDDVAEPDRTARFVCAMAMVSPDGIEVVRHGVVDGRLLRSPRGENGFGYDPLFVAQGCELTTAELDPADKDAISHRGRAVRAILVDLNAWMTTADNGSTPP